MYFKSEDYFLIIVIIFSSFYQQQYAQPKIIQSFTENNIVGSSYFGETVSGLGDINGDGFDDFAVCAPKYNENTGRVHIYLGGPSIKDSSSADLILNGDTTYIFFGITASSAGDVNGDGYGDFIIGSNNYMSDNGKAFLYFGGQTIDDSVDLIMVDDQNNSGYGFSVSSAGDINNDGYSDIIVGANKFSMQTGKAYIYFGDSKMDTTADIILTGEDWYDNFGYEVSSAGDVNNDGIDDFMVSAPGYNDSGCVFIYYGGKDLYTEADKKLIGEDSGREFGSSISRIGDVNNDNYDDIIVGNYETNMFTGSAYIYLGSENMQTNYARKLTGANIYDSFGRNLSGAGDINNDGFSDIIIGAPGIKKSYIFLGSDNINNLKKIELSGEDDDYLYGFAVSSIGDFNNDSYDDVVIGMYGYNNWTGRVKIYQGSNDMDNQYDLTFNGSVEGNGFGYSVSTAGDVNNDGLADIIVGALHYDNNIGQAYIYFGQTSMDNYADVVFTGESISNFGSSVANAGDLNSDGYDDVIIGAPNYNSMNGRAYIYFGGNPMDDLPDVVLEAEPIQEYFGKSVSTAGDVNNDGFDDVIVGLNNVQESTVGGALIYFGGSFVDNMPDIILKDNIGNGHLGNAVSTAGDVNNDGYDDVLVGNVDYEIRTGRVFLYYGGETMNDVPDVIFTGSNYGNQFGISVKTAGDINNDGFDDIIIGENRSQHSAGKSYIYYGGKDMDNEVDVIINGQGNFSYFGSSVSTAGDINNDGFGDIIIGSQGANSETGQVYINYGGSPYNNLTTFEINGEKLHDLFGCSVSNAGDVNGDSYTDIIIGASNAAAEGKVYIYSGGDPFALQPKLKEPFDNQKEIIAPQNLIWYQTKNEDYYELEVALDYEFSNRVISETSNSADTVYTANALADSTDFYWRVRGVNNLVSGFWSDIWYFRTLGKPSQPILLSPGNKFEIPDSTHQIDFIWGSSESADSYSFELSDSLLFDSTYFHFDNIIDTTISIPTDSLKPNSYWRVKANNILGSSIWSNIFEIVTITAVDNFPNNIPNIFELRQNYPNPFNPSTKIQFGLAKGTKVSLIIFNILGEQLSELVNQQLKAGNHEVEFNGSNYSSGIYFYRLQAGDFIKTKKMILVK